MSRLTPLRILELRAVAGPGGGPDKTILLGAALANPTRYRITACYIRRRDDPEFRIGRRAQALPIDYLELAERHPLDPAVWRQLRALVRTRRIDVVHSHDYKTDFLAWLLARYEGVVPLSTAHGWSGHSRREQWLYYPAERWLLTRFPRVIAVSTAIRSRLIRSGAKPDRIHVILNGIDPHAFARDCRLERSARLRFDVPGDAFVVGAVGRLEPLKRFDNLIRAFARFVARVPAAHLLIAGEGSARAALSAQIAAAGLSGRCRLLGHIADVCQFHHALDLFVQASATEGTPNAVLEAMALETPVVSTDAGGTSEVARPGMDARIVPIEDEDALLNAMWDVVQRPEDARRRADTARRRVLGELSFSARARKVEQVYDELWAGRSASNGHTRTVCVSG